MPRPKNNKFVTLFYFLTISGRLFFQSPKFHEKTQPVLTTKVSISYNWNGVNFAIWKSYSCLQNQLFSSSNLKIDKKTNWNTLPISFNDDFSGMFILFITALIQNFLLKYFLHQPIFLQLISMHFYIGYMYFHTVT